MEQRKQIDPLLIELADISKPLFGLQIESWQPIARGWLNLKWKITTEQGEFVLKKYHSNRFKNVEVLTRALQQQQRLHEAGIPCPKLMADKGRLLHASSANEHFIIMDYSTGEIVKPGHFNRQQMVDLGCVTGKIHRVLNDGTLGMESEPQFVPPERKERMLHWQNALAEAQHSNNRQIAANIALQMNVTETLDLDAFSECKTGWAHRDLWVDNLLFHKDRVSAVLDFDRLHFEYPEIDVARAILSCALHHGHFHQELASAFLEGYRTEADFPSGSLVRALRLLWYLESIWWISANMEKHNAVQTRFAEEMLWLAHNNEQLPLILGDI
ncbi:phosphotransferase [Paenibacillus profundus]|uniref:Phosphotransferase n=1 Tax=Paenibacillus profundus TaxID=1173085 RepID=A0ABS8YKP5_9BACL|nr:phosphotransferase [Paenibacillus profundus]MCE5171145.1 phosphotransferase [Paenibacillus profundus]